MVNLRNLSVLAYVNGFNVWSYRSEADKTYTITSWGYFDDASSMLKPGDKIEVSANDGGFSLWVSRVGESFVIVIPWG